MKKGFTVTEIVIMVVVFALLFFGVFGQSAFIYQLY